MSGVDRSTRDRRVLLVLAVVVAAVLAVDVASALVPGMDAALAGLPIVVVILVAGTVLVFLQVLRHR